MIIVGAGGHGRSVAEAVLMGELGVNLTGFVDDNFPEILDIWGIPVLGDTQNLSKYRDLTDRAVVAIGNNHVRAALQYQLIEAGFRMISVVHPNAIVSPSAVIGDGSMLMAGAVIGAETSLGVGVIVNSGAVIDHHCTIGDFGHLGVGASMAGGSSLGVGAWLQAGKSLGYGENIQA
jgi:UDP-3-O-[3-hydroxymyristoyl] glucosamine N-acyltransferase